MRPRDFRPHEQKIYRLTVGCASLALSATLFYGVSRYFDLVVPRFGQRFAYVALIMAAVGVWMAVRGILVLTGRGRGR